MVRKFSRVLGSRRYHDYSEKKLQRALEAIKRGESQRNVAAQFNIPRSTLKNKLKLRHMKKFGGQTVLFAETEKILVEHCIAVSSFGFPIAQEDLRSIVKAYLDAKGVTVSKFHSNYPGVEWVKAFLKRHSELTVRFATNIKKKRAGVSSETIEKYFENIEEELDDVPPENIWNYDETNLTDDPGQKKIICKRGCKYPERILNSTKSAISLMFCGNAAGAVMPPYVVYKAENLWSTWVEGGPPGTLYNRSRSGWFDGFSFQDWFNRMVLPRLKRQNGKKVLIGDNLSSHISPDVLKSCLDHNIAFICLPPNSTHLTQPLDIAYFRPMKVAWRSILNSVKSKERRQTSATLRKDEFPALLNKLCFALDVRGANNLVAGFKKAGLVPLNKEEVLSRLPRTTSHDDSDVISEKFLEKISDLRSSVAKETKTRKKVQVEPGKSACEEDVARLEKTVSKKAQANQNIEDSDSTVEIVSSDDECDEASTPESSNSHSVVSTAHHLPFEECNIGDYVIISYEGELYPGIVKTRTTDGCEVSVMEKSGCNWRWPFRKDQIFYDWSSIKRCISPPDLINARGIYKVSELN
uniref:jerky protein homolog-like n=2 Tax=Styela clava TaxID=7725 RepID=UPI00193A3401|nr:jerky protein homolog-like [Styela clava]XP_039269740.1 jerky protein homolog-like [Styela clava]